MTAKHKTDKVQLINWGEQPIESNTSYRFSGGDLSLELNKIPEGLRIGYSYALGIAEDSDWNNLTRTDWAFKTSPEKLNFLPILTENPIVFKLNAAINLVPRAIFRFFVLLPASMLIKTGVKKSAAFLEVPLMILSKTWFGSFTEGQLCYSYSGDYFVGTSDLFESKIGLDQIICPLRLVNNSAGVINVNRICLKTSPLNIYYNSVQSRLWSDESVFVYREGIYEYNETNLVKAPAESRGAVLITGPRIESAGFVSRFSFFRY